MQNPESPIGHALAVCKSIESAQSESFSLASTLDALEAVAGFRRRFDDPSIRQSVENDHQYIAAISMVLHQLKLAESAWIRFIRSGQSSVAQAPGEIMEINESVRVIDEHYRALERKGPLINCKTVRFAMRMPVLCQIALVWAILLMVLCFPFLVVAANSR